MSTTTNLIAKSAESSWDRAWYGFLPHAKDALSKSVFGMVSRVWTFPGYCNTAFSPLKYLDARQKSYELTHDSINQNDRDLMHYNYDGKEISKEKLHYVLNRANDLAQKLGIVQTLRVFPGPQHAAAIGTSFSNEVVLVIDRKTVQESNAYIDFVLAHELAHIAHNHILQDLALKASVAAVDVWVCYSLSPFLLPISEGIAAPIESFASRIREAEADQTAMRILNTSQGAIEYFSKRMEYYRSQRYSQSSDSLQFTSTGIAKVSGGEVQDRKMRELSPEGDLRIDILHPKFSERLANAQAFVPSTE